MSTIFISHSEKDLVTVNEIIRGLEQAGYRTWYFERDVLPGTSYLVQIHDAVGQCDAVVLVVSSNSISSDQTTKEVVGAFERRKPFFPILIDMTPPQLKERQPEWRHVLGGTAMLCVATEGLSSCIARIMDGLKAIGIHPEGVPVPKRAPPTPTTYTPKHLADKILASRKIMEGERKQVTVLFADVSGFTSMSEKLDPEEVHNLVGEVLVFLTEEVHRYEGTIAQFLGDGIMALFGAPIAHEDAPQRALHAALGIRERIREHANRLKLRGIEFDMRLGVNTGLVVVGRIGDDLTMEYTAMGDTVNLASRMESTAAPGTIRVAESTYRLTEGFFEFKPLGDMEVKGKEQPVKAYQLLGLGRARTRLGVSVARGLTPFVGRRKEIEHLVDCYEKSKKGQGQVVGIVGEPGVGKSRLLLQMRETLPQEEYAYLEGGCFHYGDSVPYLPLLHALRSYFGLDEGEPEAASKQKMKESIGRLDQRLETYLPALHDIFSLKVEDEAYLKLDPPHKRERTFEAIRNLLLRESQNRPLVLAVEDLHWIDKTSEEFLGQFINSLAHSHIFLMLLYRPEYTHQWGSRTYYSQIRVDELSLETSGEMVQAMLREGEAASDLRELILSRAAGNPLFMEELTRSLLDRGFIQRRNGSYVLTAKPSDIQVPETVQAIIGARIDRLTETHKQTLQVASAIGRTFSYPILQGVIGGQADLKSHLADLQAGEFVYEERLFPELEYIFKHALTQDVAYDSLLLKRRKEIHERIGMAIEGLYPDRLDEFYEVLAHHYSKSDNHEKAFQYLRMSSLKTGMRCALLESVRFGIEAVDMLRQMPDTDENKRKGVEMRLMLTGPMNSTGQMGGALQMMQEGARMAEELGDNRSLADLAGSISMSYLDQGDFVHGLEYADRAFSAAEKTEDIALIATSCLELCGIGAFGASSARAKGMEVAPGVLDLLEKAHMERRTDVGKYYNYNLYSGILAYYGLSLGWRGDFKEGQSLCQKACRITDELDHAVSGAVAYGMYAVLLSVKGAGRETLEIGKKAAALGEQAQFLIAAWMAPSLLGYACYLLGDIEEARGHFEKHLEMCRSTGYPLMAELSYYGLGLISLDSGDVKAARGHIEESLKVAQKQGMKDKEGRATVALGRVIGKADPSQSAMAEDLMLQGIKLLQELKVKPYQAEGYLYLGEFYADTGRKEEALEALRKAKRMFQEMGMDYWPARTEKALERLKG